LLARGDSLLDIGDFTSAALFYERAADGGAGLQQSVGRERMIRFSTASTYVRACRLAQPVLVSSRPGISAPPTARRC